MDAIHTSLHPFLHYVMQRYVHTIYISFICKTCPHTLVWTGFAYKTCPLVYGQVLHIKPVHLYILVHIIHSALHVSR